MSTKRAKELFEAHKKIKDYEREKVEVQNRIDREKSIIEGAIADLKKCVGTNIPEKVFPLGNGHVVVVSLANGVRVLELENE